LASTAGGHGKGRLLTLVQCLTQTHTSVQPFRSGSRSGAARHSDVQLVSQGGEGGEGITRPRWSWWCAQPAGASSCLAWSSCWFSHQGKSPRASPRELSLFSTKDQQAVDSRGERNAACSTRRPRRRSGQGTRHDPRNTCLPASINKSSSSSPHSAHRTRRSCDTLWMLALKVMIGLDFATASSHAMPASGTLLAARPPAGGAAGTPG
jgi:hypothetical protein